MAMRSLQGWFWLDSELDDGYVRVAPNRFFMSIDTYRALAHAGALQRLANTLVDQDGTHLVPRAVIEPEAAEDLRLGLSIVDPEPSEHCVYGPCILPAEAERDGFWLCAGHHELLQSWDDLVVA